MPVITVVPAYGRDYKSKAAVQADWDADKDFMICDVSSRYDGSKINKPDAHGIKIRVRYDGLRKVCFPQNTPKKRASERKPATTAPVIATSAIESQNEECYHDVDCYASYVGDPREWKRRVWRNKESNKIVQDTDIECSPSADACYELAAPGDVPADIQVALQQCIDKKGLVILKQSDNPKVN